MKPLEFIIGALVPGRANRKNLIDKFVKAKERRQTLLDYGCTLIGDTAVFRDNLHFDISDRARVAAHIGEILVDEVYHFSCKGDAVVLDIGMNRGVASLYFAAKDQVKAVYGYEPFAPTRALATRNLELNPGLSDKIEMFAYGLGKSNVTLDIQYSERISDLMSTTHSPPSKGVMQTETIVVKDAAEALRPLLEQHCNDMIIMKCDCEGAEIEIMERLCEENLVTHLDAVLMEYHFEEPHRLVEIFADAGFAVNIRRDNTKKTIVGLLYAVNMNSSKHRNETTLSSERAAHFRKTASAPE